MWWRSSCRFNKWASATAGPALSLHTPLPKLFCCRAQFVPLLLSSGEWHAILKRHYIILKNSKVKVNLPLRKCLRHLLVRRTVFLPLCPDDLTELSCVGVIASGLLLSVTDTFVLRDQMQHTSTLTVVWDLLQHPLIYKLLPCTPRRHLSLQFCHQ